MSKPLRLLFSSPHSYLDSSSGAALSTRELLEMLTARDWQCGVHCGTRTDFEHETPLEELLTNERIPFQVRRGYHPHEFMVFQLSQSGVPITAFCDGDPESRGKLKGE